MKKIPILASIMQNNHNERNSGVLTSYHWNSRFIHSPILLHFSKTSSYFQRFLCIMRTPNKVHSADYLANMTFI